MNPALSSLMLQAQLAIRRFGWANSVAVVLFFAASFGLFVALPELREHDTRSKAALEHAHTAMLQQQAAPAPPPSANEQRLQAFHDLLGESRFAEQQVKTLFAIAAKNNLRLDHGEYKLQNDSGGFDAYVILLPVHGPYGAIRQFCQQVLLAVPFASLDQVDFKRDAVNSTNLETKLRFTLYLGHSGGAGNTAKLDETIE